MFCALHAGQNFHLVAMAREPALRGLLASLWLLCILSVHTLASPVSKRALNTTQIAQQALNTAYKVLNGTLSDGSTHTTCTSANLAVRKE